MVKHIVFFRLTSCRSEAEKEQQLGRMKEIFSVLPSKLPYIVNYTTARNISSEGHAWDFIIDSLFSSDDDLKRYIISPEHTEAVKAASAIGKEKAVIDYEF